MMDPTKGTVKGEPQPPLHEADFGAFSSDDVLDLFLLVGQSNMKGRATIPMNPREHSNILFFHSKQMNWCVARDPLHAQGVPDLIDGADNSGTGPGMSFARSLVEKNPHRKIGLIPAAVGGAPIEPYGPEGELYTRSLMLRARAAGDAGLRTELGAILWLQGESDAVAERHEAYEEKLLDLVDRYRADLNAPALPFIACTIGSFVGKGPYQYASLINEALLSLPQERDAAACVDARDLGGHIGDSMHYDLDSQKEIGRRFAEAYLRLT
jgi:hypothetical protein